MKLTTIIAVIVDDYRVTLYTDKGETHQYQQGTNAVPNIVKHIIPEIESKGSVDFDLSTIETTHERDEFKEYESKSTIVKFFSVAKAKLEAFFASQEEENKTIEPQVVGVLPSLEKEETIKTGVKESITSLPKKKDTIALKTLMEDAKSSDTPEFKATSSLVDKGNQLIGLINGKVVPDVENLKEHITHANNHDNPKAIDNFMLRISKVIDERKHSMKDLMTFMKNADLPISDEGYIIAYKNLGLAHNEVQGQSFDLVDLHSRTVPQRVGAEVRMPIASVDSDRRRDCSVGLHIASRTYLSSFGGNACVMVYIDPADVIAVPQYNTNKMRVAAYTIVHRLNDSQKNDVTNNTSGLARSVEGREVLRNMQTHGYPKATIIVEMPKGHITNPSEVKVTHLGEKAHKKQPDFKEFKDTIDDVEGLTTIKVKPTTGNPSVTIEDIRDNTNVVQKVKPESIKSSVAKKAKPVAKVKKAKKAAKPKQAVPVATNVKATILKLTSDINKIDYALAVRLDQLRKSQKRGWASYKLSDTVIARIKSKLAEGE